MITQITVENFCSIRKPVTLPLTTSKTVSTDNSFIELKLLPTQRVSVLAGVFGANASGKTNFLKAFSFLYHFIIHSYQDSAESNDIPIDGFIGAQSNSKLEIDFVGDEEAYRYAVELNSKEVVHETLKKYYAKTRSYRTILKRKVGVRGPLLSHGGEFQDLSSLKNLLKDRPNASVLSAGFITNEPEFALIRKAIGQCQTNVSRGGKKFPSQADVMGSIIRFSQQLEKQPELVEDVDHLLRSADFGISGFRLGKIEAFTAEEGKTHEVPFPYIKHESSEGGFELPITRESSGTQRFYALLQSLLTVLHDGGIAIIDEMESDLHPHLIELILDLFQDPDNNPKRAQLIFTCHHVEVLNQLSKEQIVLVEKNDLCETEVYPLASIKGVRRNDNYFANYNAGRYGAIPEPSLF